MKTPMRVAVMGCVVNGLGEGAEADLGICSEKGHGVIIEKGQIKVRLKEEELVPHLINEIKKRSEEMEKAAAEEFLN